MATKSKGAEMKITINGEIKEVESYLTADEYVNGEHKFKIVEKIPHGFFVWNIGDYMGRNDLIPICEPKHGTLSDAEAFRIEPSTLKAIRLPHDDVKLLREAAGYGAKNLESTQRKLENDDLSKAQKELFERALRIYEWITTENG
ncbi:MAG: hypothetical protein K2J77_13080 [Oscillospiraceae bacterium]|nr:hypothetical protein [Oscillospiraceae bacterium]